MSDPYLICDLCGEQCACRALRDEYEKLKEVAHHAKGEAIGKKVFVKELEIDAAGLRWLGKHDLARVLEILARIVQATKVVSLADLDLWATSLERESDQR